MNLIANTMRRLSTMFPPGWFPEAKHNFYKDYGWPQDVTFDMLYGMYRRNGLGAAAANKTILRTWETLPSFWESEEPAESETEADLRQRFSDIRAWQALVEADRRSFVGGYAGAILRFADSKRFNEPVDRVPGGLDGLVEIVPAWAGQLRVSRWDTDETSETYGRPTMFVFHEAAVDTGGAVEQQHQRQFEVHPDRVIIWSVDGTVHAPSALESGYNDLVDAEKIKGAGGEGFWKNAKGAPVIEVDKEAKLADMAATMGVSVDDLLDALNEQVDDFQKGFDKLLMLQGMEAKPTSVTLPIPEHFFNVSVQSFAASVNMPIRILVGNQTGERASTEDQKEWSKACMARREHIVIPSLRELLNRLERFQIIPERDWTIDWESLLNASPEERMKRAKTMSEINKSGSDPLGGSEPAFSVDEIRAEVGFEPMEELNQEDDDDA